MHRVTTFASPEEWKGISENEELESITAKQWASDQADLHLMALDSRDKPLARCSLWWTNVPAHPPHKLSIIGHFEASDEESAHTLLDKACHTLAEKGSNFVVGPMDGSTWRPYRLVTDPGTDPPFFLEPKNPDSYPRHFLEAGFSSFAEYSSTRSSIGTAGDSRIGRLSDDLESNGIHIRAVNQQDIADELRNVYRLILSCFEKNVLFSPLAEDDFMELYQPLIETLQPDSLLLAKRDSTLVGFVLAIPDVLQAALGETVDTVIIKTLACMPAPKTRGLGSVLVARAESLAAETLGCRRSIHALMHSESRSLSISRPDEQTIRRYTLFGKRLTS